MQCVHSQSMQRSRRRLGGSLGRMSPTLRIIDYGGRRGSRRIFFGYSGLADRRLIESRLRGARCKDEGYARVTAENTAAAAERGRRRGKATVVWVARVSTRLGYEPQPAGCSRQGHPANPAARECDDHDEHLREDGFRGRHGGNEKARS